MSRVATVFRPISRGAARAIVVLFILSFLLSGASWFLSVRAVQGEIRAKASVVQLCQSGNEFRAQQVTLWEHIIKVSTPPPHETAAQKQRRAMVVRQFTAYVHQVFAPRNCATSFKG